jgi:hypothetical protein
MIEAPKSASSSNLSLKSIEEYESEFESDGISGGSYSPKAAQPKILNGTKHINSNAA